MVMVNYGVILGTRLGGQRWKKLPTVDFAGPSHELSKLPRLRSGMLQEELGSLECGWECVRRSRPRYRSSAGKNFDVICPIDKRHHGSY